jgi:uncharacterized coiled-coil DUF342 family protein
VTFVNEDPAKNLGDQSNAKLDELFQMVRAMRSELSELRQTVDGRLYDTRPIWEKVQADVSQLQEGQKNLAASQQRFEEKLVELRDELRTGFRNLKRQFSILNDTFLEVRADYKDLDNRVYKLEGEGA